MGTRHTYWSPITVFCSLLASVLIAGCAPRFNISFERGGTHATASLSFCQTAVANNSPFASGSGTSGDPYVICTATQLANVAGDLSASYELQADIDLTGVSWTPIGTSGNGFSGTFDGQNYAISNLTDSSNQQYEGLFGDLSGTVSNVNLTQFNLTASCLSGGLVGVVESDGIVQNCNTSGTLVDSCYHEGGVAGENYGLVTDSSSSANISGGNGTGGLVGHNYGTITSSFATGEVTASWSNWVGGLVGGQQGIVSNSYATGSVTVSNGTDVGGLAGENFASSVITNSYSTGSVGGAASVDLGGLVGGNGGTVTDSYWATDTSGQTTSAGGTSSTSTAMQFQAAFSGFDFTTPVWMFNTSIQPYPVLSWQ